MKPLILIVLLSGSAVACPKNTEEVGGNCASLQAPVEGASQVYVPSDEKPPRNRVPAWERGEVNAGTEVRASTSTAAENYRAEHNQQ